MDPPITDDPSSAPPPKLRLMCSYGGHIIPRPHDKSLCYVGGDTRIVVSDRYVSLSDLTNRLAVTLLAGKPFSLKYQLPSEDLDSLISVSTDEDLENMIDEYDRLTVAASSGKKHPTRIRLFLFTESKIETLIDNSVKSEEWFVSALNGSGQLALSESASVNYLLGLDDSVLGEKNSGGGELKELTRKQDVHSVPDSPGLETSSSFGSTSSSPSTMNSAPVKVDVEEQKATAVVVGIEEQKQENGGFFVMSASVATPVVVPSPVVDLVSPDSVSSDNSLTNSLSRQRNMVYQDPPLQIQYQNQNHSISSNRIPTPPIPVEQKPSDPNPSYVYPSQFEQQIHQLNPQYQQPHYIPTGSQYIPQGAVPGATYYIVYPPQQHYPSTYISARPAQPYNIQSSYAPSMGSSQNPQQFMAYPPPIHHQSQSISPSSMVYTQPMAPQMVYTPTLSEASTQIPNESFKQQNRAAQS